MLGSVVAGRYRLLELIGRGGYGEVYRALQVETNRALALKLLHDRQTDSSAIARFEREARVVQQLQHPNTVRLVDFGVDQDGSMFIAYELLDGVPLSRLIRTEGPLPPDRVARIASQILKALMEAHALGIVHRDIKPANVFICQFAGESDFVKVIDFGIAKSLRPDTVFETVVGEVVGSPAYMAPEHVRGELVGPRTDLYAVGLVMAEMLSGERVYRGPPANVALEQLSDAPVPLPPLVQASPLGRAIERATRKRESERPQDAAALLAEVLAGCAAPASLPSPGRVPAPAAAPVALPSPPAALPPPATAPPTNRANVALVATFALLAVLVVVATAAIAVLLLIRSESSSAGVSPTGSGAGPAAPLPFPEVEVSVTAQIPNPRAADPLDVARDALRAARVARPGAKLAHFQAAPFSDGTVDTTREDPAGTRMVFASFVVTEADGGSRRISLRLSNGNYLVTPYPSTELGTIELPSCSGRRAWEAAQGAGVAPKKPVWISVQTYAPSPSGVVWNINDEGRTQPVMIDAKSCEVVFPRQ